MKVYEKTAMEELQRWQKQMVKKPSYVNSVTKRLQNKVNSLIPEKIHHVLTMAIREMVRSVLFGAKYTTRNPVKDQSLETREVIVKERINFYRNTAAAEGGITGAGGILLSFADFPLLLTFKMKLLFDVAAIYGYSVKDYRERLYILHIFQLTFSSREQCRDIYLKMAGWEEYVKRLPDDIDQFDWRTFQQEYRDYIDIAKLGQFIPVIGAAVGAIVNYRLINKLGDTAINAFRMRWLSEQKGFLL